MIKGSATIEFRGIWEYFKVMVLEDAYALLPGS